MAIGKPSFVYFTKPANLLANFKQDIAPTYYDLTTFKKGEVKTALERTLDKVKRKQATKRTK